MKAVRVYSTQLGSEEGVCMQVKTAVQPLLSCKISNTYLLEPVGAADMDTIRVI